MFFPGRWWQQRRAHKQKVDKQNTARESLKSLRGTGPYTTQPFLHPATLLLRTIRAVHFKKNVFLYSDEEEIGCFMVLNQRLHPLPPLLKKKSKDNEGDVEGRRQSPPPPPFLKKKKKRKKKRKRNNTTAQHDLEREKKKSKSEIEREREREKKRRDKRLLKAHFIRSGSRTSSAPHRHRWALRP